MGTLDTDLYTPAQVRELDRRAIELGGVTGETLMERAGRSAWQALQRGWPDARSITVLCGGGNNAGDGYVVARLARQAGRAVRVLALREAGALQGDAAAHARRAVDAGVQVRVFDPDAEPDPPLGHSDVLVDAVLGTGLQGAPHGAGARLLEAAAGSGRPVLALDIPSGLAGETGEIPGTCLPATRTVTFVAQKVGLWTGRGPAVTGPITLDPLGVAEWTDRVLAPVARLTDAAAARAALPPRPGDVHKGSAGHVLVIGGDHGMGGAVRLAGEAALRAGAGLVSIATRPEHVAPLLAGRPELMTHGVEDSASLHERLEAADAVVLGPGLGQAAWGRALFEAALASPRPMVIDADGLNLLAHDAGPERLGKGPRVLTPHPGEAARLLGALQAGATPEPDGRIPRARALAGALGQVVVLKGAGTVIDDGVACAVNPTGNPGMATAGTGDALGGVLAALLAGGTDPLRAACGAVWWHGRAGDAAAAGRGRRGLLSSDLIDALPGCCP